MFTHTSVFTGPRVQGRVKRLDKAAVGRLFLPSQISQWPPGYVPACGVAHFLSPDGVSLGDVIDCHREMKTEGGSEIQRDFAADYMMWCQATLRDFVRRLDDRGRRRMRRFCSRDRTMHDAEVRELFNLNPYAPPMSSISADRTARVASANDSKVCYQFTPYAVTQEYAMLPVSSSKGPETRVSFTTFPQLRNVLYTEFDSMGPGRAISLLSGDDYFLTAELLQELISYLRRRVGEIMSGEEEFRRFSPSSMGSGTKEGTHHSFSSETPVVSFFGNGRLPWLLNDSGLLPFPVVPVRLPAHAAVQERRQKRLHARDGLVAELFESGVVTDSFSTMFPCECISVQDALLKYRPCLILVEPHVDRDWICDLRGFYTTREVLIIGPVDSPAMCSFGFPFLSFGVTSGPTTYWAYNDMLQRVSAAHRIQMPIDPPYVSQGYSRISVDNISAYLMSPNDCPAIGSQHRCISFLRKVYPTMKG
ncbi:unnamed protein product [Trypanosoma congolense IL3000]|uniref:WGS project CAEQ00000000 data, annotated contig 1485 n=1 Tax=Trypanosoma congolense (strain IL3000) TaxID=1068625 RepID=F9W6K7_TRYCI|nr:unnamed protein product [Trypanosoma congolense IL3000]